MALSLAPLSAAHAEAVVAWVEGDGVLPRPPRLNDGDHLVVLEGDRVVGLCCVGEAARPEGVPPPEDGATDVWVAVEPGRRCEGLATRACDLVVETLRVGGHARLRATLPAGDVGAERLARRCGFSARGEVLADDGSTWATYGLEVLL